MLLYSITCMILLHESCAYNILSILPFKGRSHNIFASAILDGLAEHGHNVTVFTVFPRKKNLHNYREIDIDHCFPFFPQYTVLENVADISVYQGMYVISDGLLPRSEDFKSCTPLQELLSSTQKFDVLMTQPFGSDVFATFSYKLNIPLINIFPMQLFPHLAERMGSISNPSIIPSSYLGTIDMDFFDRARNLYHYFVFMWYWYFSKRDEEIVKKWLGSSVPPLEEITKNTSLIFTGTHFSYTPSVPLAPGIVEIGGIHIRNASKLPENIEKFINESTHGVIYFSMGSFLQSTSFTEKKRNAFFYAFSKIPQRVLWKFENDSLPGKPDNILISKWMPQRDILAHPRVKLFISHGGIFSTSEAIYEGVPILGIPIFADQRNNMETIEANSAGEVLEYSDISNEIVLEKIRRLINVPKYKEGVQQMSIRYRDRPLPPTDTAVYWTEYVIRHKGAHHLKTAAADMPWYQYFLLDVIAFIIFVSMVVVFILYSTIKVTMRFIWNIVSQTNSGISKSAKKEKKN